jgi:hypothetical protein
VRRKILTTRTANLENAKMIVVEKLVGVIQFRLLLTDSSEGYGRGTLGSGGKESE